MKILVLSTPVAPLGSGLGGGVELKVKNVAREMTRRGHRVQVVAPENSFLPDISIITIAGNSQTPAQTLTRDTPICLPGNAVLANMWHYARTVQEANESFGSWTCCIHLIVCLCLIWLCFMEILCLEEYIICSKIRLLAFLPLLGCKQ